MLKTVELRDKKSIILSSTDHGVSISLMLLPEYDFSTFLIIEFEFSQTINIILTTVHHYFIS
jgi:hypothetical protein